MFFPFLLWEEPEGNPSAPLLAFSEEILTGTELTTTQSTLPFLFTVCFCWFSLDRIVNTALVLAEKSGVGSNFVDSVIL